MRLVSSLALVFVGLGLAAAAEEKDSLQEKDKALGAALMQFVRDNGGTIDDRQEVRRVLEGDASSPRGLFATSFIPEGTVLCSVPWNITIHGPDENEDDLCLTAKALYEELKLYKENKSTFAPYLDMLTTSPKLPDAWSAQGKELLKIVIGHHIEPQNVGQHADWWKWFCLNGNHVTDEKDKDDPLGIEAATWTVGYRSPGLLTPSQEAYQEVMVPFIDLYTHRDGTWWNTEISEATVGKNIELRAKRHIKQGEPLHRSTGFGAPLGTDLFLRDGGFVEQYPQRFTFKFEMHHGEIGEVEFDVGAETSSPYVAKHPSAPPEEGLEDSITWVGRPSPKALAKLQHEVHRLEQLGDVVNGDIEKLKDVPAAERAVVWRYREALLHGIRRAVETTSRPKEWKKTEYTFLDYPVAGVNLASYRLMDYEEDEDDDGEEAFELFSDFDIGHLIKGDERWEDLVKYRRELERPSLSFYVDKIARKRWLPTMGYDQPKHFLLNYAFELTESGKVEDETQVLLEALPNETDYAAKPTHHSETSGVWLVSRDQDTGKVIVSSKARQLIPDDGTFSNRIAAEALANNLHAEAAKHESWILKNVNPGVVIEERFVEHERWDRPPIEVCIFVIWGRVWAGQFNYIEEQNRHFGGFIYRNGTMAKGTFYQEIPFKWFDWPLLVKQAEELGRNKDMFRADFFVGIPSDSPTLKKGATMEERLAHVRYAVSECELHPTTVFHTDKITDEAARLWVAGYMIGNYKLVPNDEVPEEFFYKGFLSAPATNATQVRDRCRRYPMWRQVRDTDPMVNRASCAAATGYSPERFDYISGGSDEFRPEDKEWQDRIEKCMDEKFLARKAVCEAANNCSTSVEHIPEPEVESYVPIDEKDDPVAVIVKNAISEEEAATLLDIKDCIIKYHKPTQWEHRPFQNNDGGHKGGNDCTFMGGFLQKWAPGVAAQIKNAGVVAWAAGKWGDKEDTDEEGMPDKPYKDPRAAGIRTSGHLSYTGWKELGPHADSQSLYTVLTVLADPEDYEGGEIYMTPSNRPATEEEKVRVKPDRLSALVFLAEQNHGVEPITSGYRQTCGTELWAYGDIPFGILRPEPKHWANYQRTGDWWSGGDASSGGYGGDEL